MRKKHLDFLIIPEGSPKDIRFRLALWKVWTILGVLGCWIALLILLTIFYGRAVSNYVSGRSLLQENERLKKYNAKVTELEKEIQEYRRFTEKVAELAGIEYPFTSNVQKKEPKLALLREDSSAMNEEEILSSLENSESLSKLSGRLHSDQQGSFRSAVDEKAQIARAGTIPGGRVHLNESDSVSRIPKGQPIDGWITKGFSLDGYAFGGEHTGIDFAAKEGTKVKVTADGTVSFVGWDDVYGNLIVVDHKNGYVTYYGHNSKTLVSSGNFVRKGQVIALSGNSGRSSAPHLHYEIRKDSLAIDPKDFLNPK
jgi:murein DD-endopeptidase MepM/ murein hydrolase activator NlpD